MLALKNKQFKVIAPSRYFIDGRQLIRYAGLAKIYQLSDKSSFSDENSKTSVLALFPYSKLLNLIIWKKQSLFERQGANKKILP